LKDSVTVSQPPSNFGSSTMLGYARRRLQSIFSNVKTGNKSNVWRTDLSEL